MRGAGTSCGCSGEGEASEIGQPQDVPWMREQAETESDPINRGLAARALARLTRR